MIIVMLFAQECFFCVCASHVVYILAASCAYNCTFIPTARDLREFPIQGKGHVVCIRQEDHVLSLRFLCLQGRLGRAPLPGQVSEGSPPHLLLKCLLGTRCVSAVGGAWEVNS